MLQRAIWIAVGATVVIPAAGLAWQSAWRGVLAVLACGAVWLLALRGIRAMAGLALTATAGLAAFAALLQLNLLPLMAGLVAGACSYDLLALRKRVALAEPVEQDRIAMVHLRLLLPGALAGFFVGTLALVLRGTLGFAGLVGLALLSVLLLTRAVQRLRKLSRGSA